LQSGKKVLVLERRHVLGVLPLRKRSFLVFFFPNAPTLFLSYDQKSFENWICPHGLEILPLDGTFTPMPAVIICGG